MKNTVYILTLEGEPQYVTKDITQIEKECRKWFDDHYDNWSIQQDYRYWLEDRTWYPNTDEGEEHAWEDYVSERFNDGEWGDYAWYESFLK